MGSALSFIRLFVDHCYPPKPTYDVEKDIPDLTGKVIIVTGGNTGIGKETVKALLKKNAKVYLGARSRVKAEAAIADLKRETGKEAIFLELNLADLSNVTRAAKEFMSKETALHVLFNSAGVMVPPMNQFTTEGWDLQFGTNVLGPAHFTLLLLPTLIAGARSSPDGKARVVNTSSLVVFTTPYPATIKWDTLRDGPARNKFGENHLYEQSKYGVIAFSNELARRYADQGILSNAVNPGNLGSDLQRHVSKLGKFFIDAIFSHPVHLGALTQLYVGTSPECANDNGQWFKPWARRSEHSAATRNPEVEGELWNWLQEQHGQHL